MGTLKVHIAYAWLVWQRSVCMWRLSFTKLTLLCVYEVISDVQAYWIMPSNIKRVQGVPGHAIDYTTSVARKRALDQSFSAGQSDCSPNPKIQTRTGGSSLQVCTLADLKPLTDLMHENRSGLCAVMEDFCHLYADPVQPRVLPKSLLRIYDPQMKGCQLSVLLQYCDRLKHCVVVSKAEAEALEEKTREQHKCDLWHTSTSRKNHFRPRSVLQSHTFVTLLCGQQKLVLLHV
ncbi:unnamed protein product [Oreochromis niloticus]|nr:unnamed protein product [Mustela putorius furo]